MGVSGMMHGYIALDVRGGAAGPFRTWRNNITGQACAELTPLLDFAVPQRWSIAHLYQSILEGSRTCRGSPTSRRSPATSTGSSRASTCVGVGEASGMFPIDPHTGDWDAARMATVRHPDRAAQARLEAPRTSSRTCCPPGAPAGGLTAEGREAARPVGHASGRHSAVPSRGRRGHRAWSRPTPSARVGERLRGHLGLRDDRAGARASSRVHEGIDIVVTPDGKPVAMAHSNNGSSDLDAWIGLFGQVAKALGHRGAARRALRSSCRSRSRAIRTRAGSCPSTTSPAST